MSHLNKSSRLHTNLSKDSSDDSASDSDADSGSDSSSDEEEDSTAAAEAPSKKRKAESDSAPVSKKAKSEHDPRASKNLFIGNIAWGVDEDALTQEFEEFGALVGCRIMTDKATGRSKGYVDATPRKKTSIANAHSVSVTLNSLSLTMLFAPTPRSKVSPLAAEF